MQITCPHCGFSKQIDAEQIPPDATRVNCPKCTQSFSWHVQELQPHGTKTGNGAALDQEKVDALPKAGFWIRLVATFIDVFIVFALQFMLGSLLALAGFFSGVMDQGVGNISILIQLFGYALSFAYSIVFTGYCGQTPGKMALRIKVIRQDGEPISYGRAAFREIPAKFISGIIFCIGYLMVAFDEQKQGLHDRMANTYVIKL